MKITADEMENYPKRIHTDALFRGACEQSLLRAFYHNQISPKSAQLRILHGCIPYASSRHLYAKGVLFAERTERENRNFQVCWFD